MLNWVWGEGIPVTSLVPKYQHNLLSFFTWTLASSPCVPLASVDTLKAMQEILDELNASDCSGSWYGMALHYVFRIKRTEELVQDRLAHLFCLDTVHAGLLGEVEGQEMAQRSVQDVASRKVPAEDIAACKIWCIGTYTCSSGKK